MRLLLFADLHLDTAFAWAPENVARRRRQNLRDTLTRIVTLAHELDAEALLIAGDLYEQERFTPDTAAFLARTLNAAGRPVLVAPGNHDWLGPDSLYAQTDWGPHVKVFSSSSLEPVELEGGLTLWGAAHRAPANTDGFLAAGFKVDRGGIHLALFHGSEQSGMPFQPEGKQPHAPFTEAEIEEAGLHHVFCGHFHKPREGNRHTYPGAPDPLTFGDSLEGGAVEVEVQGDGTVVRRWHHVRTSDVHDLEVDVSGSQSMSDVRDTVAAALAGLRGSARVTLGGEVAPSVELDTGLLQGERQHLDALVIRAGDVRFTYDFDRLAAEQTVRGQFVRDVRGAADLSEEDRRRVLVTGLRALEGRRDLEVV
jgi:DNA repair exonuclease SbcCD nuclease subunit